MFMDIVDELRKAGNLSFDAHELARLCRHAATEIELLRNELRAVRGIVKDADPLGLRTPTRIVRSEYE